MGYNPIYFLCSLKYVSRDGINRTTRLGAEKKHIILKVDYNMEFQSNSGDDLGLAATVLTTDMKQSLFIFVRLYIVLFLVAFV